MRLGAIEGGGTKFMLAIADGDGAIIERTRLPTSDPSALFPQIVAWFAARGPIDALGFAMFGPVRVDPASTDFGRMLPSNKAGWARFDVVGPLEDGLGCPVALVTDVTGAAIGEHRRGAGRGARALVYLTVGTGIGGALLIDGQPVPAMLHAEMGHGRPRRIAGDSLAGVCAFHADCYEGLAAGPAIAARRGVALEAFDGVPDIEAGYVAQLCATIVAMHSPHRIVIGGGVMAHPAMLALVRAKLLDELGGYLPDLADPAAIAALLVPPALGGDAGVIGAALFARDALAG